MLKLIILGFVIASAVPYCNCNNCHERGTCADNFSFKLIDKTTGQDLVFGSNPRYASDSLLLQTNYTGYPGSHLINYNNRLQSSLHVPVDTFFLRVNSQDIDTLVVNYDFVDDKCCVNGQYGKLKGIRHNGIPSQKVNDDFVFEK